MLDFELLLYLEFKKSKVHNISYCVIFGTTLEFQNLEITIRDPSSAKCANSFIPKIDKSLQKIRLQPENASDEKSRRRSRNGRIKIGRVKKNGSFHYNVII